MLLNVRINGIFILTSKYPVGSSGSQKSATTPPTITTKSNNYLLSVICYLVENNNIFIRYL